MSSADLVVLGAGPAGLAAAWRAARAGRDVVVLERASAVGGMAASFEVAGFIGRALVTALVEHGPVVGIDRRPQGPLPGLTVIEADLLDSNPEVRAALADAAVVHHLAGCPDVRDQAADVAERRHRDNVLATAAVLAAVAPRVAVLVASSSSVYGGSRGGRPSAEPDRLRPRGGYASSKVEVERLCRERAATGHPIGTVNIGTGVAVSLGELVAAVGRALGTPVRPVVEPAARAEVAHTLADVTRLGGLLGWVPRTDLDDLVGRQLVAGGRRLSSQADQRGRAPDQAAQSRA